MSTPRPRSTPPRLTADTGSRPLLALPDELACWHAVMSRSRTADGLFVYAVATTGIYCRPSCSARRPHRQNVRFFATPERAEAAGFRACKRCRPTEQGVPDTRAIAVARITEACRRIESSEEMPSLTALARSVGLSPSHFHRTFTSVMGVTPKSYTAGVRAERIRQALQTAPTITAAVHDAGFPTNARFYAGAREILGMSPKSFRAGGAGEQIHHVTLPSSLGLVLIATTINGICAVMIADRDGGDALKADLARRFPKAELIKGDASLADRVRQIVERIEKPGQTSGDLPIDLRGTAFQLRVWAELQKIPPGQTTTYGDLARSIGAPRAVRAVARACGANPVAVLVPCHRVIGADGALTGYRWGIERKQTMLEREGSAATDVDVNGNASKGRRRRAGRRL